MCVFKRREEGEGERYDICLCVCLCVEARVMNRFSWDAEELNSDPHALAVGTS